MQAVVGHLMAHHAFMITEHLSHLDTLDEAIERMGTQIAQCLQEEQTAIDLLDTLPGVSRNAAEILLAEIGPTLDRFPDAEQLAAWAGICPGNAESGGKRLNGKTRKGNVWLRQVLIEIAHVASKTKATYLAAQYRRIAARRGKKRALVGIAHRVLKIVYEVLKNGTVYEERLRPEETV